MLKKTIQFENFLGETVVDDFYFHLSKADLVRMELGQGGMEEYINRIVKASKGEEIVAVFEKMVKESYGVRSIDGRSFVKNEKNLEEFLGSGAYNVLFMELCTDAEKGAEFVRGLMPPEVAAEAEAKQRLNANPGISQNLAAHLSDESFNVPETLAVVPEPQLTDEQFRGYEPVQAPTIDEIQKWVDPKQASPNKNVSKKVLVAKFQIKAGKPVQIDREILDGLTAAELDRALETGSELV